jgi:hypothetical protein
LRGCGGPCLHGQQVRGDLQRVLGAMIHFVDQRIFEPECLLVLDLRLLAQRTFFV